MIFVEYYQRIQKFMNAAKYLNLQDTRMRLWEFGVIATSNLETLSKEMQEIESTIRQNITTIQALERKRVKKEKVPSLTINTNDANWQW